MFEKILQEFNESTGATGSAMLDWEGEIVAFQSSSPDLDLSLMGAQYGAIVNLMKEACACIRDSSGLRAIGIKTAGYKVSLLPLKDGYYLLVIMERGKPFGRVMHSFKRSSRAIEEEMG